MNSVDDNFSFRFPDFPCFPLWTWGRLSYGWTRLVGKQKKREKTKFIL